MTISYLDEMLTWILHPGTYEMSWYILLTVCWFGFTIERRLKHIQKDLAAVRGTDAVPSKSPANAGNPTAVAVAQHAEAAAADVGMPA